MCVCMCVCDCVVKSGDSWILYNDANVPKQFFSLTEELRYYQSHIIVYEKLADTSAISVGIFSGTTIGTNDGCEEDDIDWNRCKSCKKDLKLLINHLKKSVKCQEQYDMLALEVESKERAAKMKKLKNAEYIKKHYEQKDAEKKEVEKRKDAERKKSSRDDKLLINPETRMYEAEKEKKRRYKQLEEGPTET